jgi:hypothetical protein
MGCLPKNEARRGMAVRLDLPQTQELCAPPENGARTSLLLASGRAVEPALEMLSGADWT